MKCLIYSTKKEQQYQKFLQNVKTQNVKKNLKSN